MRMRTAHALAVMIGLGSSTSVLAQATGDAGSATPPRQIDTTDQSEIVVTAQRREERLQDVPVAVTAISGPALVSRQISSVVDIMSTVPNLHASNNIGQGSATTAFIRGVGETESIITVDTPVGFYLDDVYIGRQGVNNMALFDVDRIEVLRGPQGTLYGRNTSAGAIKVVTTRPQFETGAIAEAGYGRFDSWSAKGSVNMALSSVAAIRVNAIVAGGGGDTYNRTLDTRVNDHRLSGGRIALRLKPNDDLDINLAADISRDNQNGRYGIDVSGILRPASGSLYTATTDTDIRNVGKTGGAAATIEWSFADTATLRSISAYRETSQRYNIELTDQAPSLYTLFSTNHSRQISQELQVTGTALDERLDYVAGVYLFDEKSRAFLGDFIFQFLYFRKDIDVRTKSAAAFGQINFQLADQLTAIVGGRYTRDRKRIGILQLVGGTPGFANIGGAFVFDTSTVEGQVVAARPGRPVRTRLSFNKFTPKVGLEYKPGDDVMMYATYTQGFKSGGWSARVTDPSQFIDFDPETVNSYEVGIKTSPLNRRATLNLTGFYYDYKGLFSTGTRSDGSFGIATSDARLYGLELETSLRVASGVRIYANGAWEDGKRTGVTAATLDLGRRFQRFPKWSGSAGINVDRPISDDLNILANADYSYTGKHFVNPQNTAAALTGPISLVNASIGLATSDRRYQVTLGCRNCFGERYINQILDFAALGFITVYPGERSNWRITARANF